MDKPFLTLEEQRSLLSRRGLGTDSCTTYLLEREGYFAIINGYKDLFLKANMAPERFREGSKFSEIYRLFIMDRRLRYILFRFLTFAEASFKSVCTYQFCRVYPEDNEAYLKCENYRVEEKYRQNVENLISDFRKVIYRGGRKSFHNNYLFHYANHHDNIPLWVLMNNLTLGQAYRFYDCQNESIRFAIARRFQYLYERSHSDKRRITHSELSKAFNCIREFRNLCAHDERLYCARIGRSGARVANLFKYLEFVLTEKQYSELLSCFIGEIRDALNQIEIVDVISFCEQMGFSKESDFCQNVLKSMRNCAEKNC